MRSEAFPREFMELLGELGIPPVSEVEVYHNARLENGRHSYGGWFHFVGRVVEGPDGVVDLGNGFQFYFRNDAHFISKEITERPVAQLEFYCELRWGIAAQEAL